MEQNQQITKPTRKETAIGRLKKKYPDKKFEDEEEIYGQIVDDYDALDSEVAKYKSEQEALYEVLADDEGDLADRLLKATELNEVKRRREENKALEEEYKKNEEERVKTLAKFQDDNNLSDEELDAVWDGLLGILTDFLHGKVSMETLRTVKNGIDYDKAVSQASHEGELRGRNAKIEERLNRNIQGDGLGALQAGHNSASRQRGKTIFDDAALAR